MSNPSEDKNVSQTQKSHSVSSLKGKEPGSDGLYDRDRLGETELLKKEDESDQDIGDEDEEEDDDEDDSSSYDEDDAETRRATLKAFYNAAPEELDDDDEQEYEGHNEQIRIEPNPTKKRPAENNEPEEDRNKKSKKD